ncbi:MAG TPA: hypothetical protein VFI76_09965 [Terrimicrobiaceae bacterium]|nr:hypothetical protein [Terrimicrobiaceae bacterium]
MSSDNDDPGERGRVFSNIAPIIMDFHHEHIDGSPFHADELREYVLDRTPMVAPSSPDRILRELRLVGRLNYVVLNRRQSLYQFRPLTDRASGTPAS